MVFRLFFLLSLLGAISTAAGAGGPVVDCMLDIVGTRGACAGVCAVDQLPTVMAELPTTCQTTIENFVKENSCTDSSCNQYKYFYDRFFGDRTRICKLMDDLSGCSNSLVKKLCGEFGLNLLADLISFGKGHMDCDNPTATNAITCVANPDFIVSAAPALCFTSLTQDPFIQGLVTNPDINIILQKLKDSKGDFCRIYDSVTKCLLDAVANQASFNTYCSTSNLQVFKDMVSDFKQLLGCTNEANYDLLECGLKVAGNYQSLVTNCDLVNKFTNLISNPTTSMNCDVLALAKCVTDELAKVCGATGWTVVKGKQLMEPVTDYFDYKFSCNSPKPTEISTCGCFGEFPVGDKPSTGTCAVTDTLPKCSGSGSLHVVGPMGLVLVIVHGLMALWK